MGGGINKSLAFYKFVTFFSAQQAAIITSTGSMIWAHIIHRQFCFESRWIPQFTSNFHGPVGQAVTRLSLVQEVEVPISGRSNQTQCCWRFASAAKFLWNELCCPGTMTRSWAPQTRYALRRNTASVMKDLIWFQRFSSLISFCKNLIILSTVISLLICSRLIHLQKLRVIASVSFC